MFANGFYYGALVHGKRHGKGTFIYSDGSRYTGNWVDDKEQGTGYLFDADGNQLHHGVWYEGKGYMSLRVNVGNKNRIRRHKHDAIVWHYA